MEFIAAQDAPPTPDEFRYILEQRGAETAAELFDRFDLAARQPPVASEAYLNAVGYRFLQMRRVDDAVRVLRMGARCYPASSNAWDSYGEACLAAGDTEEARRCYVRALEVLPTDSSTTEETKDYIRNHAREVLEQLGEEDRP